jgi:putative CRISPR-associated protein (TIGR02619 family)
MPTFVLSTVGTSILTNTAGRDTELRNLVFAHANAESWEEIPEADRVRLRGLIESAEDKLKNAPDAQASRVSAELNGILTWHSASGGPGDQHVLVGSQTALGQATANLAVSWLKGRKYIASVHTAPELQTKDGAGFRRSMSTLLHWVGQQVHFYRDGRYGVTFNLCGGFKGPNGFLHSIGSLYADEVVYLFENTNTLLRVPRLPVTLDHEKLALHLPVWRQHAAGLVVDPKLADPLIFEEVDGQLFPSQFAELIMTDVASKLYSEGLHPSPHPRLSWTDRFANTVHSLPARRKRQINERIDDLSRHIEDRGYNPRRLDVKELRAEGRSKRSPSTWECDAWNDEDGKRIFFHKEGVTGSEKWIIDSLDSGLH